VCQELHLIHAAFQRIMHHASPSIQTLFVTSPSNRHLTFPLFALPNLTDFSVTSVYDSFADTQTFPSLKRFHTDFVPVTPSETPIKLRVLTPALEELCFINLRRHQNKFTNSISDQACSVETGDKGDDSTSELAFPDAMERILLRPSPPPYNARCGTPWFFHNHFMNYLIQRVKSLAESEYQRARFRVVLLEWPTVNSWHEGKCSGLYYDFYDASKDWTDVLVGEGKGCWNDANRASADSLNEYDPQPDPNDSDPEYNPEDDESEYDSQDDTDDSEYDSQDDESDFDLQDELKLLLSDVQVGESETSTHVSDTVLA